LATKENPLRKSETPPDRLINSANARGVCRLLVVVGRGGRTLKQTIRSERGEKAETENCRYYGGNGGQRGRGMP